VSGKEEKARENIKELLSVFKEDLERLYAEANGAVGIAEYEFDDDLLKFAGVLDELFEWCSDLADPKLVSACIERHTRLREVWRNLCATRMRVKKAKFDVTGEIAELKKKVDEWIKSLG
jgi:hypothetical protein